jgi:small conductance mechanosensitive channel
MNPEQHLQQVLTWVREHGLTTLLIVVGAALVLKLATTLNRRLFATFFKGRQDAESQKLAQTVTAAVHWVIIAVIVAAAVVLVLSQFGLDLNALTALLLQWAVTNGLGLVLIVALTVVAFKAVGIFSGRLLSLLLRGKQDVESRKRAETLASVIRWLLRTVLAVLAAVMILGQLGVKIGPVLAAAGVVGLAVGIGAQSLVQDLIAGFFILLEDQVRVGDIVQLDSRSGVVERITLRMIILRDFAGNVHYVRNGKIDVVTNMTKEFSRAAFEVGVAYREDVDEVIRVIQAVGAEMQQDPNFKDDILMPVEVLGLDRFADSALIIKGRFQTAPGKQWRVLREFNRRIKKRFDELGIEIPFPHLTLYPGKNKNGDSPTLKLEVQGRLGP